MSWFGAPQKVQRQRAGLAPNPITGDMVRSDWQNPEVIDLEDAAIDRSSTSAVDDATRTSALEARSLFCPGDADVQFGDRIVGPDGEVYGIDGIPDRAVNPFTGWAPPMEVPLKRGVG